ncbi:MAG: protein translocase subunit SecF [Alphaproteobacteria bacterium]|nr:protein translocase subunit SecF [Alphaproteobacteria bacterium]
MLLKLVPDSTNIPFVKWRWVALGVTALAALASIMELPTTGLNFGVDFRGGITIEVSSENPIDIGKTRATLAGLGLGDVSVQAIRNPSGGKSGVIVFIEEQTAQGGDARAQELAQQSASQKVQDSLKSLLGPGTTFPSIQVVGPTVSAELVKSGVEAVFFSVVLMAIYIAFRFEWQFGLGAVVALVHDVFITLGMLALTKIEFNLPIIAALLTIVGYSVNDTVVVYDRIREDLRKYKKKPLPELINDAINSTLSRTVMTSGTTLMALFALLIFGGPVLRGFIITMIFGIMIGTYSSIFIASPILLATGIKRDWSAQPASAAP